MPIITTAATTRTNVMRLNSKMVPPNSRGSGFGSAIEGAWKAFDLKSHWKKFCDVPSALLSSTAVSTVAARFSTRISPWGGRQGAFTHGARDCVGLVASLTYDRSPPELDPVYEIRARLTA